MGHSLSRRCLGSDGEPMLRCSASPGRLAWPGSLAVGGSLSGVERGSLTRTKRRAGLGPPSLHREDNREHLVLPFAPRVSAQVTVVVLFSMLINLVIVFSMLITVV